MRCSFYVRGAQCEKSAPTLWEGRIPLCPSHRQDHNVILRRLAKEAAGKTLRERVDRQLEERAERKQASVVYFIRAGHRVKIGRSANVQSRLWAIRSKGGSKAPVNLDTSKARIIATIPGHSKEEREIHERFAHLRESGEWFRAKPELMNFIKEIAA